MKPRDLAAFEFLQAAYAVQDLKALEDMFERVVAGFGYRAFTCMQVAEHGRPLAPTLLCGRSHEAWDSHYWERQFLPHDPCVGALFVRASPYTWADFRDGAVGRTREMFNEARAFGLQNGMVVPVHGAGGELRAVRLLSEETDLEADAQPTIHALSVLLAERSHTLVEGARDYRTKTPLTAREREVLCWIGEGKSDWDMGAILGISENTVHFHVKNAMAKLGARTRLQAWSKAMANGWLVTLPD
jgi:DNA-binding CsgD family transcriptional regulator